MAVDARSSTIARAKNYLASGEFLDTLGRLVAVQTESHPPSRKPELERYCHEVVGPYLKNLGFKIDIFDNPLPQHGPFSSRGDTRIPPCQRPWSMGMATWCALCQNAGAKTWTHGL